MLCSWRIILELGHQHIRYSIALLPDGRVFILLLSSLRSSYVTPGYVCIWLMLHEFSRIFSMRLPKKKNRTTTTVFTALLIPLFLYESAARSNEIKTKHIAIQLSSYLDFPNPHLPA